MREGPGWHLVLVLQVEAGIGEGDSVVGLQLELGRRGSGMGKRLLGLPDRELSHCQGSRVPQGLGGKQMGDGH